MDLTPLDERSFVRSLQERALENFVRNIDIRCDFQKHTYRGITIVVVNLSRAVMCESEQFYKYLFNLIDEGAEKFVVDLTTLEFIDSSFAGVLVAALKRLKNNCGDIRLVLNSKSALTKQLFFSGVMKIYRSFPTIQEALNSFEIEKNRTTQQVSRL